MSWGFCDYVCNKELGSVVCSVINTDLHQKCLTERAGHKITGGSFCYYACNTGNEFENLLCNINLSWKCLKHDSMIRRVGLENLGIWNLKNYACDTGSKWKDIPCKGELKLKYYGKEILKEVANLAEEGGLPGLFWSVCDYKCEKTESKFKDFFCNAELSLKCQIDRFFENLKKQGSGDLYPS